MSRPASKHPTELELEILKILWNQSPLSVRQVQEALSATRELAYTSVMTVLNIMTRKGYLRRKKHKTSFLYAPRIGQAGTTTRMLRDLVDRVFGGSAAAVMLHLLQDRRLDKSELDRVRALINKQSKER